MPKKIYPDFLLRDIFIDDRLSPKLNNWKVLHAYIAELPVSKASIDKLESLMVMEFDRDAGPRAHIIERLHGKYDVMRRAVEFADMQKIVSDLVKRKHI